MIGRRISHYRFLDVISEGGAGSVYKAEDLTLGRTVAIKVLKADERAIPAGGDFLREAQAVARIDHPNVVTLYEVLQEGSECFLVMQFIAGESLRETLRRRRLGVAEAISIARQIGAGLGAAHQLGVVHRDLKPENVMVDSTGRCMVLDFGVAHLTGAATLSGRDRMVGSIPYMAPEQVLGEPVDARTDVHALGLVLFEMLAGHSPYEAEGEPATLYQILHVEPPDIGTLVPDLPEGLPTVIAQALSRNPAHRYRDMDGMLHDLELIQRRLGAPPGANGDRLLARPRRAHRRALVTASLGIVVLASTVFVMELPEVGGRLHRPRVFVTRWENRDSTAGTDWLASGIMDGVIRSLSGREGLDVVSRQAVAAVLQTLRPANPAAERAAALTAARRLGAGYLVSGVVEPSGAGARLSCELTDVRTGLLTRSWAREVPDLRTGFSPAVEAVAGDVAGQLWGATRGRPRIAKGASSLTASFDALIDYNRALEHLELRDVPAALVDLRHATALDSTFVEAHEKLARVTREVGERREHVAAAMRHRDRATEPTRLAVEADDLLLRGRTDDAILKYQEIVERHPDDLSARSWLASVLMFRRRFDEVVAQCTALREASPYDYSFVPTWSFAYVEIGRNDKALAILRDWHHQFPGEEAPIRELIGMHDLLGSYRDGLALCDTLDLVRPGSARSLRGFLLLSLGRIDQAESLFRSLIDRPDPYSSASRAYSWLALVAWRRERYARGTEWIERALERQPEPYNYWLAGLLAAGARDTTRVRECLRRIATAFENEADASAATEAFGSRRFYYHLEGVVALSQRRPEEAARLFERSLAYAGVSDSPYFRTYFGRALLEAGQTAKAIAEFERVLAFNPNYAEALLCLGRARLTSGDVPRARQALERLGQLWKEADADDPLNLERRRLVSLTRKPESDARAVGARARDSTTTMASPLTGG